MTDEYKTITYEKKGHVAEIFLNRPDKRNAMGPDFWPDVTQAFMQADEDKDIWVVVLAANGEHFTAGLDLKSSAELMKSSPDSGEMASVFHRIEGLQESMHVIEECRKPVIAAVHGACIGGGLDMIAACDIRLCSKDARYSLREARLGIIADLGSLNRLPRIIGEGFTKELAYTAKDIDAERALAMGLVSEVFPNRDATIDAARKMAEEIASNPPLAVQGAKEVINYNRDKSVRDGLLYAAARSSLILKSRDLIEAVTAFLQKRKPEFKGD